MEITVVSDIHVEFHKDAGMSFISDMSGDVLVLAGDTGLVYNRSLHNIIEKLSDKFRHIVGVFGNHEYYNSDIDSANRERHLLNSHYPNVHFLENNTVTIDDQRFVGCTMWFPMENDIRDQMHRYKLNDFNVIGGFTNWFAETNQESIRFLKDTVQSDDIVITHHIPTPLGSAKKWNGSPIQQYFICPAGEDIIREKQPKLWVYGHTHDCHDFTIGRTRLVCNPFGYMHENTGYDYNKIIDTEHLSK